MRIKKIEFNNINNIKGHTEIDFSEEPLNSAGIFVITGPTGSGKTTILDVITLALFNKIPRFKGIISKTTMEGLGSVMTHHTESAYASIVYEIHGRQYKSEWKVSRIKKGKNKGNINKHEMSIYDESEKPLDLYKRDVPAENEKIIGLTYDQFIKSIILSQGEFARFLKADKNERGLLLENLTGSSIYRKIGSAVYQKFVEIKKEVDLEKDRLGQIQTLTDEERKVIKSDIDAKNEEKIKLEQSLKKLQEGKQVKTELQEAISQIEIKKEEQKQVIKEEKDFVIFQKKLDTYESVSPWMEDLTRYKDGMKSIEVQNNSVIESKSILQKAQNSLEKSISEMSTLTNKKVDSTNFKNTMSDFEKEINFLDQEIKYIQKEGKELRSKIVVKAKKKRISIASNPQEAISNLQNLEEEYSGFVKKSSLTKNRISIKQKCLFR